MLNVFIISWRPFAGVAAGIGGIFVGARSNLPGRGLVNGGPWGRPSMVVRAPRAYGVREMAGSAPTPMATELGQTLARGSSDQ